MSVEQMETSGMWAGCSVEGVLPSVSFQWLIQEGKERRGLVRDKGEFKIPKSQVCLYIEGMEPVEREGCGFRRTKAWDTGRG